MLTRPIVALAALALTAGGACAGSFDADLAAARALACPAEGRLGAGQPILGTLPLSPSPAIEPRPPSRCPMRG